MLDVIIHPLYLETFNKNTSVISANARQEIVLEACICHWEVTMKQELVLEACMCYWEVTLK